MASSSIGALSKDSILRIFKTHPLKEAAEVLNIPPLEQLVWNNTVGARLLETQFLYPGEAAVLARADFDFPIPSDAQFNQMMLNTAYTRFMKPVSEADEVYLGGTSSAGKAWKYDFSAMKLVQPLRGLYCAPDTRRSAVG